MIALFQLEASRSGGVTLSADSGGGDAPGGFDSSVTLPAALRQGGALSVVSALTGRLSLPKCAAQLREMFLAVFAIVGSSARTFPRPFIRDVIASRMLPSHESPAQGPAGMRRRASRARATEQEADGNESGSARARYGGDAAACVVRR
jgi:hypothetical protein